METANQEVACIACGSMDSIKLPVPVCNQSMLSDGKIVAKSLEKKKCRHCGMISHCRQLTSSQVAALYSEDYKLPVLSRQGDQERADLYCSVVLDTLGEKNISGNCLDIGCGSGALLKKFISLGGTGEFVGIDPALPPQISENTANVRLIEGLLEEVEFGVRRFDTIISINTIEHVHDPEGFLCNANNLLSEDGNLIVICPSDNPANVELLFYDHLWTYTTAAMKRLAYNCELEVIKAQPLEGQLKGFKIYHFKKKSIAQKHFSHPVFNEHDASHYLLNWVKLDEELLKCIGKGPEKLQIFGAGQMAALLRAYAPETFSAAQRLVVDDPLLAWPIGKTEKYNPSDQEGWVTVVAVHPRVGDLIAKRVVDDGGDAVVLPIGDR
ncbi:MAG: class I SAM-dependent methyltransferase [Rhizobiaceae bacterium]